MDRIYCITSQTISFRFLSASERSRRGDNETGASGTKETGKKGANVAMVGRVHGWNRDHSAEFTICFHLIRKLESDLWPWATRVAAPVKHTPKRYTTLGSRNGSLCFIADGRMQKVRSHDEEKGVKSSEGYAERATEKHKNNRNNLIIFGNVLYICVRTRWIHDFNYGWCCFCGRLDIPMID